MDEIVKHINDTNASYRDPSAGDAKNTDLYLDNDQHALFEGMGDQITVKYSKSNLAQAILFIASILPRKYDNSSIHKHVKYTRTFVEEQLDMLDGFFKIDGQPVESITQKWKVRINVPMKNGEIDNRFYFNGLLQDFEYLDENSNVRKSKFTIRNYLAGSYSDLHIKKDTDGTFKVWVTNAIHPMDDGKEKGLEELMDIPDFSSFLPRQIIYYGAPGTGKSHAIKIDTKGEYVVRTTFHPDSDYSTFVGAYKPTTKPSYVRDSTGRVVEENGEKVVEDRIVYEFVPQAFLQAYVDAWRYYAKAGNEDPKKQYLVIEEINRGNCAQIFGDLFQLLDRNDEGYSEYPISADKDMEKYLSDAFRDIAIPNEEKLADLFDDPSIAHKIGLGQVLVLPPNLYIWATMNTSDQSLFPIDSAFKRRWDWRYIPISEATDEKTKQPLGWSIHVGNKDYDWWSFLQAINDKIGGLTNSQDKKLGYFFCKANNGMIDAETLVGKVFFFLWNEVLKDFEQEQDFLKDGVNGYISFDDFYYVDNTGKTLINEDKVDILLNNLGVRETVKNMPEDVDNPTEASPATKDLYKNFWSGFNESYEDSGEFKSYFTNPNGLPQSWLNLGGLNRKYYLALTLSVKNKVASIQLYFPNGESEFDKYNSEVNLDKMKKRINGIIVHNTQGTKCKYFSIEKPFDITKDNRQDVYDWYHKNAVIFKLLCEEIDPKK